MEQFSIQQAGKILDIDHTAIREWLKLDFIVLEDWQKANGRGTKAILTIKDVARIFAFSELLAFGFTRKLASKVIQGRIPILKDEARPVDNKIWDISKGG